MAKIAEVREFERNGVKETVKVDPGSGDTVTADHVAPSGVDAPPLVGDDAALVPGSGAGTQQAVGYSDPDNTRTAISGEFRCYARNAAGELVGEVHLKRDGSIVTTNQSGRGVTLSPDGVVHVDGSEVLLGENPGRQVMLLGDLFSGATLPLIDSVTGAPIIPAPPFSITGLAPNGGILVSGSGISGARSVKGD
jgi:hypothetical protein